MANTTDTRRSDRRQSEADRRDTPRLSGEPVKGRPANENDPGTAMLLARMRRTADAMHSDEAPDAGALRAIGEDLSGLLLPHQQAEESDRIGKITDDTARVLRESGGIRLLQAKDSGGYEEDPKVFFETKAGEAAHLVTSSIDEIRKRLN